MSIPKDIKDDEVLKKALELLQSKVSDISSEDGWFIQQAVTIWTRLVKNTTSREESLKTILKYVVSNQEIDKNAVLDVISKNDSGSVVLLELADVLFDNADEQNLISIDAVSILIHLSRKGTCENATKRLNQCLKNKTGISEENLEAVKWCVETSIFEKKVRESSRLLFQEIGGEGEASLSPEEFKAAVKMHSFDKTLTCLLISAGKEVGDEITSEKLSRVLSQLVQGDVNLTLSEKESRSKEYESADIITKVTKYPEEMFKQLISEGQEVVSKDGMSWVTSMVPKNQLYMLSTFFLYSFLSASFLLLIVPLLMFYLTLAILLMTTLLMVINTRKLKNALLLAAKLGLDEEESKWKFLKKSLSPYWMFLWCAPFLVVSYALSNKTYIPCSEILVLSVVAAGAACFGTVDSIFEFTKWIGLFLNLIAALPTLLHNFPEIPILSKLVGFTTRPLIVHDSGVGFTTYLSLPSIAYSALPALFIVMTTRHNCTGAYRTLLPFLVTQFWLNFARSLYPYSTWFGLLRSSIGNLLMPVIIPTSLLIGSLYGMYQAMVGSGMVGKIIIALVIGGVPLILSQTESVFGSTPLDKKYGFIKKMVMLLFVALAIVPLTTIEFSKAGSDNIEPFKIDWKEYKEICLSGSTNRIHEQLVCSQFVGQSATWNGTLESVKITKVSNSLEPMLAELPSFASNKIKCVFGERRTECNSLKGKVSTVCKKMKASGHECHLNNYNTYSYQLTVQMPDHQDMLYMDASDRFAEILSLLLPGDKIEMTVSFAADQGLLTPTFNLQKIRCIGRQLPLSSDVSNKEEEIIESSINNGIAAIVQFFLHPIVEYSEQTQ